MDISGASGVPDPDITLAQRPAQFLETHALSDERMASRGIMNIAAIQAADADRNYEAIWTAITLEMFCRQFIDGDGSPDSNVEGIGESEIGRARQGSG